MNILYGFRRTNRFRFVCITMRMHTVIWFRIKEGGCFRKKDRRGECQIPLKHGSLNVKIRGN